MNQLVEYLNEEGITSWDTFRNPLNYSGAAKLVITEESAFLQLAINLPNVTGYNLLAVIVSRSQLTLIKQVGELLYETEPDSILKPDLCVHGTIEMRGDNPHFYLASNSMEVLKTFDFGRRKIYTNDFSKAITEATTTRRGVRVTMASEEHEEFQTFFCGNNIPLWRMSLENPVITGKNLEPIEDSSYYGLLENVIQNHRLMGNISKNKPNIPVAQARSTALVNAFYGEGLLTDNEHKKALKWPSKYWK